MMRFDSSLFARSGAGSRSRFFTLGVRRVGRVFPDVVSHCPVLYAVLYKVASHEPVMAAAMPAVASHEPVLYAAMPAVISHNGVE